MLRKYISAVIILIIFITVTSGSLFAQDNDYHAPGNGNPVIPGFFADPSLVKFDSLYYIYATTVSKYMEPVVWISRNLKDWRVEHLGITGEHRFWAPSVIKGDDGKYYLYYSNGFDFKCHLYIGESPTGPWEKFGLVEEGFDLQVFKDPTNNKVYGLSSDPKARPRIVEFESNPESKDYLKKVVLEKSIDGPFFDYTEGSFVLYRNGVYYLMYSGGKCHTENYNIRYATSQNIWGPYTDAPNNPILEKDPSKKIYGPGHHSVIEINGEYLIAYHRQDFQFYPTCSERQVCLDKMEFDDNGFIRKIVPTNKGIDFNRYNSSQNKMINLAYQKQVTCSNNTKDNDPEYAVDENLATRWVGGGSGHFTVDLGKDYQIEEIQPLFMYYDYFNLYKILVSDDNRNWEVYFDQTGEAKKAHAPVAQKRVNARYVKVDFLRGDEQAAALTELRVMGYPQD